MESDCPGGRTAKKEEEKRERGDFRRRRRLEFFPSGFSGSSAREGSVERT